MSAFHQALVEVAESPPVRRVLRRLTRRGGILAYHNVLPDGPEIPPLHVSATQLQNQLCLLQEAGATFISLAEFLDRIEAGHTVARCLAVTFDDAYRGTALAVPVLKRLQVPATLFVPTGTVGSDQPFWWDTLDIAAAGSRRTSDDMERDPVAAATHCQAIMRARKARCADDAERQTPLLAAGGVSPWYLPMSWPEIRDWLSWDGAACGPHTVTHPVLPRGDREWQELEIVSSYTKLREECPRVLPILAYPFGLYDLVTVAIARKCGLRAGVTMDRFGTQAREDDCFRLPRIPAGRYLSPRRLELYLSGVWRWFRQRRDWEGGVPRLA